MYEMYDQIATIRKISHGNPGECDINDFQIRYAVKPSMYDAIKNMPKPSYLNNYLNSLPISNYGEAYGIDMCVVSKCSNGSKPINIGRLLNKISPVKEPINFYGCIEPKDNNGICKMGIPIDNKFFPFDNNMCLNLPSVYAMTQ